MKTGGNLADIPVEEHGAVGNCEVVVTAQMTAKNCDKRICLYCEETRIAIPTTKIPRLDTRQRTRFL